MERWSYIVAVPSSMADELWERLNEGDIEPDYGVNEMPNNKGPAPKLIKVESIVETCSRCGAWQLRSPEYSGGLQGDKDWQCDRCGCTSVNIRRGRPYGPKSRLWPRIVKDFNEMYPIMHIYEFVGIVSDPPLPDPHNTDDYKAWEAQYWSDE